MKQAEIKTQFASVSRYRRLQQERGTNYALYTLLKNIGANKGVIVSRTDDGGFSASVGNIESALFYNDGGIRQVSLPGIAKTVPSAMSDLFKKLLAPATLIPHMHICGQRYVGARGGLVINESLETPKKKFVQFIP